MRIIKKLVILLLICSVPASACAASLNEKFEAMVEYEVPVAELAPVSVALIDTGIDTVNLDSERILQGESYVSDKESDLVGHGTRIASLIIGAGGEDSYISDLAPNASLVPLIYYSAYPSGVPINGGVDAICAGIYDAVDKYNCAVIIISSGITQPDAKLEEAVLYAEENNVIVISAAGNDGGTAPYYPASYPTVVGVGSVDENKSVSAFSQRNEGVTVVAPGEGISAVSIKNGNTFEKISGTSYSCAYVGALAAQLRGAYPDMTPGQFRWLLQNTSVDLGPAGYDTDTGFGLINMKKAMAEYPAISKTAPLPYGDVSLSAWFYGAVRYAYENGLMNGVSDTAFAPNTNVTRAMPVTVLYRLDGEPPIASLVQREGDRVSGGGIVNAPFTDVTADAYYANAVIWAQANGIVKGVSETEFAPDENVTREQIAAILWRYAQYKGYDVSVGKNTNILSYTDFADISEYAIAPMQYAVGSGLMKGKTESTLNPKDNATRAEIAAILQRFIEGNK